jgi:anti-sigma B factor antagonist
MTVDSGQSMGDVARLRVALEAHAHGLIAARVSGSLDIASTAELDAELSHALAAGPCETLVLDLHGVDVLDSTGLRALWTIRHATREVGARLVLRRPSRAVLHVLEAAGLTAMFEIA